MTKFKFLISSFVSVCFMFFVAACETGPTKSHDSQLIQAKSSTELKSTLPVIVEHTVVIDARPPFEFALSHLNGSVNLRWEDFAQRTKPFRGLLDRDYFSLASRLATYGISPQTQVVVVGRGLRGEGEEGRLAWTFKVLGVQDVRFASIESFSLPRTKEEAPLRKNEALWKPVIDSTLTVDRDLFVKKVFKTSAKASQASVRVIDVRNEAEYLGKDSQSPYAHSAPDIGAINIPWGQFFDTRGLTKLNLTAKLEAVGITKDQEIYVIDNQGVRSASVTLALREMGFFRAANFAGGYMELIEKK